MALDWDRTYEVYRWAGNDRDKALSNDHRMGKDEKALLNWIYDEHGGNWDVPHRYRNEQKRGGLVDDIGRFRPSERGYADAGNEGRARTNYEVNEHLYTGGGGDAAANYGSGSGSGSSSSSSSGGGGGSVTWTGSSGGGGSPESEIARIGLQGTLAGLNLQKEMYLQGRTDQMPHLASDYADLQFRDEARNVLAGFMGFQGANPIPLPQAQFSSLGDLGLPPGVIESVPTSTGTPGQPGAGTPEDPSVRVGSPPGTTDPGADAPWVTDSSFAEWFQNTSNSVLDATFGPPPRKWLVDSPQWRATATSGNIGQIYSNWKDGSLVT